MMIEHFYHVYADGQWQVPLQDHLAALKALRRFGLRCTAGVVGTPENRARVLPHLQGWEVHEADTGWEQTTLDVLHSRVADLQGPVLYAHTKGAANPSETNTVWRKCMTRNLINVHAVSLLAAGADTVGCHWLTPEAHPKYVQIPYYGGNFWWSRREHLLRLDAPSHETRYHAEAWLGTVEPHRPADLHQQWPGMGCA